MYRFRLQRILDYRCRRTESLAWALHLEQQQWHHEKAQLEALQAEKQAQQQQLEATQGSTLLNGELKMLHLAHRGLEQRIEVQDAALARVTETLAAKQQALIKARQDEKMMEKLRAKQERRYVLEYTRREQQLVDEVAIMRSGHEHTAFADGNVQS
jgi:flagellar export protein FliJ